MSMQPPRRGTMHEHLTIFLGDWRAEGTSYGGTDQSGADPKANGEPWRSTHSGRWHTGEFYLIQDERAVVGGTTFDTLAVIGVGDSGGYVVQTFDNLGFSRRYDLINNGASWTLSGPTERAVIEFSADGRKQMITWEWKPEDTWLPLCDRVATRTDATQA